MQTIRHAFAIFIYLAYLDFQHNLSHLNYLNFALGSYNNLLSNARRCPSQRHKSNYYP